MERIKRYTIFVMAFIMIVALLTGCSSSDYEEYDSYDSYSTGSEEVEMGEVIRQELGDGPAEAYYEGERRWNAMTGQE